MKYYYTFISLLFLSSKIIHTSYIEAWKKHMCSQWKVEYHPEYHPGLHHNCWDFYLPPGSYLNYDPTTLKQLKRNTELDTLITDKNHSEYDFYNNTQHIHTIEAFVHAQAAAVGATEDFKRIKLLASSRVIKQLERRIQELTSKSISNS